MDSKLSALDKILSEGALDKTLWTLNLAAFLFVCLWSVRLLSTCALGPISNKHDSGAAQKDVRPFAVRCAPQTQA